MLKQHEDGLQSPRKPTATSQHAEALQINNKEKWVEKYQSIYLEEYGRPIDKAHALDELTALLCFLNAVQKHINKE